MPTPDPPEQVTFVPTASETRAAVFCVLVKRTYDIIPGGTAVRAAPQPLRHMDAYHDDGDPDTATIRYESEVAPYKLATDVVVVGSAHAPNGRPVRQVEVAVEVGRTRKVVRVIGDRRCVYREGRDPGFTDPDEFTRMEVRYERAYGGRDLRSVPDLPVYYPRNYHGAGLVVRNVRNVVDHLRLPNLEDPSDLLTPERLVVGEPENWHRMPLPQGLGWFQKTWFPRCSFVGVIPPFVDPDAVLREETLGLVPKRQIALGRQLRLPSYDVRFNTGASAGLAVPFLRGDEAVRLVNLTPDGELRFNLPGDTPRMALDIGLGTRPLAPVLHTVLVRPDDFQVDLVWRGAQEYPGADWLPEMKRLVVEVAGP